MKVKVFLATQLDASQRKALYDAVVKFAKDLDLESFEDMSKFHEYMGNAVDDKIAGAVKGTITTVKKLELLVEAAEDNWQPEEKTAPEKQEPKSSASPTRTAAKDRAGRQRRIVFLVAAAAVVLVVVCIGIVFSGVLGGGTSSATSTLTPAALTPMSNAAPKTPASSGLKIQSAPTPRGFCEPGTKVPAGLPLYRITSPVNSAVPTWGLTGGKTTDNQTFTTGWQSAENGTVRMCAVSNSPYAVRIPVK
ncbi:hypothetical protein M1271_00910 [Patescibacteria group bacterium]|nr:hypothetical protein [Patescibacteria group bacterium]